MSRVVMVIHILSVEVHRFRDSLLNELKLLVRVDCMPVKEIWYDAQLKKGELCKNPNPIRGRYSLRRK